MSESWQLGSRYTLERKIGSGATGQVWVGHDVDGHALAFKLLRPELADDPAVVARFLQERNLLVGLRSPYVIRVHDLVVEGPRLAIVMDYVAGDSLRALLQRRGNLSPADVATLGAQIAHGLAAVHAAGVLHRDLKPENVLLDESADDTSGPATPAAPVGDQPGIGTRLDGTSGVVVPKLADFGVASLVTQTGHVATANVIGTPQYLAPELGDGQPSGRAGDLYALGVTLYEMACGAVPFHADSPVALLRLHADHAPTRPDGIPDALWALIARLLAKNPQERPDDAATTAAQLEQLAPTFVGMPAAPLLTAPPLTQRIGAAPVQAGTSGDGSGVVGAGMGSGNTGARDVENAGFGSNGFGSAGSGPDGSGAHGGDAGAGDTSDGQHRRSLWLGVALVVALALVALVAWLLLRDSSHGGSTAKASPSASPTSSRPSTVPLATVMTDGARVMKATFDGSSDSNAVVPLISDRASCTGSVRFDLDGRYANARFVVGSTKPQLRGSSTATIRLDGRAAQTVTLGGRDHAPTNIDLHGARVMVIDVHSSQCSPGDETSPVAFTEGTLTTT